jgi:Co/Zn/Cd efflux system component
MRRAAIRDGAMHADSVASWRDDRIADLHFWRLGPSYNVSAVSLVADRPEPLAFYKARLAGISGLSHVTIEVHPCPGEHPEP